MLRAHGFMPIRTGASYVNHGADAATRREAAADAQHSRNELRRDRSLMSDGEIDEAIAAWDRRVQDPDAIRAVDANALRGRARSIQIPTRSRSHASSRSRDNPSAAVNIEFHHALGPHFQQERLTDFLIRNIGAPHELADLERLFAQRAQDILSIIQHDTSLLG